MKKKNISQISIEKNELMDKGEGIISFVNGLVITDNGEQRNGTKYDIDTMDLTEYRGMLTADHSSSIQEVIGKTIGLKKQSNKVVVSKIEFAVKESALARYAYNMLTAGYLTDFSIETFGPWPDEEGIYKNAKLIGLSLVVTGNNRSATLNDATQAITLNSLEQSKKDGLDTSSVEKELLCYNKLNNITNLNPKNMFVTIKNSKSYAVKVSYKNAAGDAVEKELAPGETVDVSADQKDIVEGQVASSQAPKVDVEEMVKNAVQAAIAPLREENKKLEQKIFDNSAKEPEFQKAQSVKIASELDGMDYEARTEIQINSAVKMLGSNDQESASKLRAINEFHLAEYKKAGIVKNSVTMGDFGNFVISREMITEIQGFRSDYANFLSNTEWKETLSLDMAWMKRSGDINMQSVEMCDDGSDGNLKPISEYAATIKTASLEELAAVTPICNSATRFLAADLLGDVAQGYRTDYDRKRAQLVIARMQQAVNETGNGGTYTLTSDINGLKSMILPIKSLAEKSMNGSFIMNYSSYWELVSRVVGAGSASPVFGNILTTGDQPTFFGKPLILVPDDLMPGLNTAGGNKSFVVNGVTVTINQGLFYGDLRQFTGRISGGLKYDLSTEAAYEEGGTVKSAFQRNELVLRGSFFRGGAIKNTDRFAGLAASAVS